MLPESHYSDRTKIAHTLQGYPLALQVSLASSAPLPSMPPICWQKTSTICKIFRSRLPLITIERERSRILVPQRKLQQRDRKSMQNGKSHPTKSKILLLQRKSQQRERKWLRNGKRPPKRRTPSPLQISHARAQAGTPNKPSYSTSTTSASTHPSSPKTPPQHPA